MSLDPSIRAAALPADPDTAAAAPPDAAGTAASATASADGRKLTQLAAEFESMLMVQMLREMRKAGSWKEEGENEEKGFGAEALFDTLDVELASHLTKAQGFGLEKTLVRQISGLVVDSIGGASRPAPLTSPLSPTDHQTTSAFGWRRDPFTGAPVYHRGVDVSAAYGEPVGAAAAGRVVFAGEQGDYGQTVVVEHGDGVRTRYAHLSAVLTEPGTDVAAGEAIGRAGRTGRATGTHLHFEMTKNGRAVDPRAITVPELKPERVVADLAVGAGPDPSSSRRRTYMGESNEDRR